MVDDMTNLHRQHEECDATLDLEEQLVILYGMELAGDEVDRALAH
jgi:hypothetical protein